jgi:DeoR/GlpR family transcriptional regulator of sugar metabolism
MRRRASQESAVAGEPRSAKHRLSRARLLALLEGAAGRRVPLDELAALLRADRNAVVRHVRGLVEEGLVTRGTGWVAARGRMTRLLAELCPQEFVDRADAAWVENRRLARAVLEIIQRKPRPRLQDISVFIDVGSTCLAFAEAVVSARARMNIWTPNLPAALYLVHPERRVGQVHVIAGEAESESLGVKGSGWTARLDFALVSIWQVTPSELLLRSVDYYLQKRAIIGLGSDSDTVAAQGVIVVAGSHRLVKQRTGGEAKLASFDELSGLLQRRDVEFYIVTGRPEGEEASDVLKALRTLPNIRIVEVRSNDSSEDRRPRLTR